MATGISLGKLFFSARGWSLSEMSDMRRFS